MPSLSWWGQLDCDWGHFSGRGSEAGVFPWLQRLASQPLDLSASGSADPDVATIGLTFAHRGLELRPWTQTVDSVLSSTSCCVTPSTSLKLIGLQFVCL